MLNHRFDVTELFPFGSGKGSSVNRRPRGNPISIYMPDTPPHRTGGNAQAACSALQERMLFAEMTYVPAQIFSKHLFPLFEEYHLRSLVLSEIDKVGIVWKFTPEPF